MKKSSLNTLLDVLLHITLLLLCAKIVSLPITRPMYEVPAWIGILNGILVLPAFLLTKLIPGRYTAIPTYPMSDEYWMAFTLGNFIITVYILIYLRKMYIWRRNTRSEA